MMPDFAAAWNAGAREEGSLLAWRIWLRYPRSFKIPLVPMQERIVES